MRMYRLGEDTQQNRWPFLAARHAYLADGTPLTDTDERGRIVPARQTLDSVEKICSGGSLSLSDRQTGIEALARALDRDDLVRAPILLLQLQIDEVASLEKYNPFHKPPGPGGGQFASGPGGDGDSHFSGAPLNSSDIEPVAQTMNVEVNSTYKYGVNAPDIDRAHDIVMNAVRQAILGVGSANFRPGMPGYGQLLHTAIALEILAMDDPAFLANPIYLDGNLLDPGVIPKDASLPDVVYAPAGVPRVVFEVKSGRATDTNNADNIRQREKALENIKGKPQYEYIQVYEK
jgi:hypothetical protein